MAAPQSSPASIPTSNEDTKPFACIGCSQRKVKCDKRLPCLACLKSRLQCTYRSTPPPQRRKRKVNEDAHQAVLERLRSYEATLRSAGLPFETFDDLNDKVDEQDDGGGETTTEEALRARSIPAGPTEYSSVRKGASGLPHRGLLVSEHGGRRYYEHGLIGHLAKEYRQNPINFVGQQQETPDMLAASVLTGLSSTMIGTQHHQHPPSNIPIMKYWSIYINNVHPLTKVLHAPSIHQIITGDSLPKNLEALRYSIYACAVASLTDKECQRVFGESQAYLLHMFQSAARSTLLESSFLSVPDLDLLRAHILLVTSMLHTAEPATLWILMGTTIRIAQSQGLHRDGATFSGLSPFEVEMRRRLWWYIVTLDSRLTELMGSQSCLPKSMDTQLPSNVNDDDLDPGMTTAPKDYTGASGMTFCLVQYEIARFMQEHGRQSGAPPLSSKQGTANANVSDLESFLEEKFLRFCDPVVATQLLTTTVARSSLCKLRQMARHHRPRPRPDNNSHPISADQSNKTLNIAARNIEYDNLIHSSRSLRGFFWHVNFHFPWGAPIFLLKSLIARPDWDDDMQAAWDQIEELYEHHPEYLDPDKLIHLIVGGLTIKAWSARESVLESRGIPKQHRTPAIITALQSRHGGFSSWNGESRTGMSNFANEELNFADMSGFDITGGNVELMDPLIPGVDWSNWGGY